MNIPKVKSNLQINVTGGVLRTDVSDSVKFENDTPVYTTRLNNSTLNNFRYGAAAILQISPDSRYGLQLGCGFSTYRLLSDRYVFKNDDVSITQSMWAEAFLKTSNSAKLFFRYGFLLPTQQKLTTLPKFKLAIT